MQMLRKTHKVSKNKTKIEIHVSGTPAQSLTTINFCAKYLPVSNVFSTKANPYK